MPIPAAQLQKCRTDADAGRLARQWGKAASEADGPAEPVQDVAQRLTVLEQALISLAVSVGEGVPLGLAHLIPEDDPELIVVTTAEPEEPAEAAEPKPKRGRK